MVGQEAMVFSGDETDQFGHKKLGGIGDRISEAIKRFHRNSTVGSRSTP